MLSSNHPDILDDLCQYSRQMQDQPFIDHMDLWHKFFRFNVHRMNSVNLPILIMFEGDYIPADELFDIFCNEHEEYLNSN